MATLWVAMSNCEAQVNRKRQAIRSSSFDHKDQKDQSKEARLERQVFPIAKRGPSEGTANLEKLLSTSFWSFIAIPNPTPEAAQRHHSHNMFCTSQRGRWRSSQTQILCPPLVTLNSQPKPASSDNTRHCPTITSPGSGPSISVSFTCMI